MQFTKLRLLGFKSFVDPTELMIAPGLTGVVGPNGCGKSNLLEALRWVMGENRPTAMRGGGMDDVIFAGASSRPARNYAEVTLHLDNSDRLAPAAFNDADNLEIIRRITREAGSAYKTNGKDARARDVQMLFADASTGAHSPALVRQGQISELINAKPKARRRVLEEAAGISGLYQRRHEAELKLRATEGNLERVEDVLENLRTQLSQLERQARQAARYREIGEGLRQAEGLLLFRRWTDAEAERLTAAAQLTEATKLAGAAQVQAAQTAKAREAADTAMPALREEEAVAGAIMQRQLVARDALDDREARAREEIRSLTSRIEQLTRDAERERGLNRDAGERITELEWEARAITEASEGQDAQLSQIEDKAAEAAEALKTQEAELDRMAEDAARLSARHQSAERRVSDANSRLEKTKSELEQARVAAVQLAGEKDTAVAERETTAKALADAQSRIAGIETALAEAETARAAAQEAEGTGRGARAEANAEMSALEAEVTALRRLIDRDSGDGPQILDAVRAEPGFEAALGAALGDDLKAPETDTPGATGWHGGATAKPGALPGGAVALGAHVTAPDVLAARLAQTGVVDQADGARLQPSLAPGQRLVSREGDLWRWDGFTTAADDAPSAAALRLQQKNRLAELEEAASTASARAAQAEAAHTAARQALDVALEAEREARTARKTAEDTAATAMRAAGRAESAVETLESRLETVTLAQTRRSEDLTQAEEEVRLATQAMTELADLDTVRAAVEAARTAQDTARQTMMAARSDVDRTRREIDSRTRRAQEVAKEISGWRHRLETAESRISDFDTRLQEDTARLDAAKAVPDTILEERSRLVEGITQAEDRCAKAGDALAAAETTLRESDAAQRTAERTAGEARETRPLTRWTLRPTASNASGRPLGPSICAPRKTQRTYKQSSMNWRKRKPIWKRQF